MTADRVPNKYETELLQLGKTYEFALKQDVKGLCTAIAAASESSIIGVGSGGSYTVASLLCNLHETYTGRVSRPSTPLEIICNPNLASTSPVFLISAEGKNPDIIEALIRVRYQSARSIHVLTNRDDSELTVKVRELSEITPHIYNLEHKDGYLATNSLLLDAVLVARSYAELDQAPPFPESIDELKIGDVPPAKWVEDVTAFVQEVVRRKNLIVVYSPWLRPVAYDLESKVSEGALLHCQLADIRSFAHGRHLWMAKRPEDCAILALIEPSMEQLWSAMSERLPKDIPVAMLRLNGKESQDIIAGILTQMHLVASLARYSGVDAGAPDVPSFGREIYYLKVNEQIERPNEVNDLGERSKFDVLGARWPTIAQSGTMKRARDAYRLDMQRQNFRAIVFDYDGTLCPSSNKDDPPPPAIVEKLKGILEGGVIIGIASGRGSSVAEAMYKVLPEAAHQQVILGLYNAGRIVTLAEHHKPNVEARSDFLSHVTRIVNSLKALGIPIEKVISNHPHQVSVRFREGISTEQMWYVFGDALHSEGLDISRMVRSKHSVDILAPGVSKSRLVAEIVQRFQIGPYEILTMGDQGAWPGNDFALLEHRYSVSVDYPSRRLDRGWKFAPDHKRNVDATLWYLDQIKVGTGSFQLEFDLKSH